MAKNIHKNIPKKQPAAPVKTKAVTPEKPKMSFNRWLPYLAALAAFVAFIPALHNEFTNWDDIGYITENFLIRSLNLKELFSTNVQANYHPLTMLTYAIEYHFVQLSPWLYHFDNILLHVLNTLLVYVFIHTLTKKPSIAFITALVFGVHPMHVESVAWVSERKDVLYVFFLLLAAIAYTRWAMAEQKKSYLYAVSLLLFVLSCLAKGQAVSFALIVVLIDFILNRPFDRKVILEKVPFFIIALIFGIVAVWAQKSSDAIQDDKLFAFYERIIFASYGYIKYLINLIAPANLSAFYPYPMKTGNMFPTYFYICPFIVIGLFAAVWYFFRNNKYVVFGLGFFSLTIVFVIQLVGVGSTIMSDRYSYLPYIGLGFLLGYAYQYIRKNKPSMSFGFAIFLGIWLTVLLVNTRARCEVWKNSYELWSNVIENYKGVPVAYNNRGLWYKTHFISNDPKAGDYLDRALADYNEAEKVDPTYQGTYENRANIYFLKNQFPDAMKDLDQALKLKPGSEVAINTRGAVYFNQGMYDKALENFDKAIHIKPDYIEAYRNRGNAYSVKGMYDKALADYTYYIKYEPTLNLIYYWRGIALYKLNKYNECINDLTTALNMQLSNPDVLVYRARAYAAIGNKAAAKNDAIQAEQAGAKLDQELINSIQ